MLPVPMCSPMHTKYRSLRLLQSQVTSELLDTVEDPDLRPLVSRQLSRSRGDYGDWRPIVNLRWDSGDWRHTQNEILGSLQSPESHRHTQNEILGACLQTGSPCLEAFLKIFLKILMPPLSPVRTVKCQESRNPDSLHFGQ